MIRVIVATHNPHKAREFQEILGQDFAVQDLVDHPEIRLPPETGATFQANAALKALAVSHHFADLVIGDDSGLEVDALSGAPGVYSARYSEPGATDARNIEKLQDELANCCHEQRTARFRCVIALARNGQLLKTFAGAVEGTIIDGPRGEGGFGYDPVFQPAGFSETFGELPGEIKNGISHRAHAAALLRDHLRSRA